MTYTDLDADISRLDGLIRDGTPAGDALADRAAACLARLAAAGAPPPFFVQVRHRYAPLVFKWRDRRGCEPTVAALHFEPGEGGSARLTLWRGDHRFADAHLDLGTAAGAAEVAVALGRYECGGE